MRRRARHGRGRRALRTLEPVLLLLLHRRSAHGYTLLEQLGEFSLQALDPSMVYRALHDMEEKGWATSTWDDEQAQGPPRRVYRLTAQGDEVLRWYMQELQESRAMIDRLLSAYNRHMEEGEGEHH